MSIFRPAEIINRFDELDIKKYKDRGYKAIILDIDNTLAIPGSGFFTSEARYFVNRIGCEGLKAIIVSNNTKKRVSSFVGNYPIEWYYWAFKPLPFMFNLIIKKHGYKPEEVVVLGDQLLTDILGANLSGCCGVYTKQLVKNDTFLTSINRVIEKFIWRHILHEKV